MHPYDTTVGTLLMGIFLNTFLYGLVTYQFAAYHLTKFNDPPATRYMVLFLFILDTFHSASLIYMAWSRIVTNYGNLDPLSWAKWPLPLTPLATALAAMVTQMYLGSRIRHLTNNKILHGMVIVLAIPSFVLGTIYSIAGWTIKFFSELSKFDLVLILWSSTQVAADTLITVTLTIVFYRSRTGFRKTDAILNRFIRCAIQTGLFADIFSLANLITYIAFPDTYLFALFGIPLGRIYTNTLMDTLLTRRRLMVKTNGAVTDQITTTDPMLPTDTKSISGV